MTTGLAVIDTTVQDTNLWLKRIEAELGDDCERQEAYAALRAVLHTLRDRLQPQAAVNFAAQLPMLVRGLYFEGWMLTGPTARWRSEEELDDAILSVLPPRFRFEPRGCARAVFATITEFTSPDEARKLAAQLPEALRSLWA